MGGPVIESRVVLPRVLPTVSFLVCYSQDDLAVMDNDLEQHKVNLLETFRVLS